MNPTYTVTFEIASALTALNDPSVTHLFLMWLILTESAKVYLDWKSNLKSRVRRAHRRTVKKRKRR